MIFPWWHPTCGDNEIYWKSPVFSSPKKMVFIYVSQFFSGETSQTRHPFFHIFPLPKSHRVGGLEHEFLFSHVLGVMIIPIDDLIFFQRGRLQPPTSHPQGLQPILRKPAAVEGFWMAPWRRQWYPWEVHTVISHEEHGVHMVFSDGFLGPWGPLW